MSAIVDAATENKKNASNLAVEISKQFLAIAFAGIAFTIGISSQDGAIMGSRLFWGVIVVFAISAVLGFCFLMHGVSKYAKGEAFAPYGGGARFAAFLQSLALAVGVGLLLWLHVESVESKSKTGDQRLQIEQTPKGTTVRVSSGRKATISISEKDKVEATVE